MEFSPALEPAILLRRYKRFLADIRFPDGSETTVHCPNPGAMMGVAPSGARCFVSRSASKTRKLPLTLEMVECPSPGGAPILTGINTHRPNKLAEEAVSLGLVEGIDPNTELLREVRYGEENSRIDLLARGDTELFIEVKNCHLLRRDDRTAEFPDCVTKRGLKHLRELVRVKESGAGAMLLFIVQRQDAEAVRAAADLDPAYAEGLSWALENGVLMRAVTCKVTPAAITPLKPVPVLA